MDTVEQRELIWQEERRFLEQWEAHRPLAQLLMKRMGVSDDECWHLLQLAFWMAWRRYPSDAARRNTMWWCRFQDLVGRLRRETMGAYCVGEKRARHLKNIVRTESLEYLLWRHELPRPQREGSDTPRELPSALISVEKGYEAVELWYWVQQTLTERQYRVIQMLFLEEKTLIQTAHAIGLSEARVRQICNEGLCRLRESLRNGASV